MKKDDINIYWDKVCAIHKKYLSEYGVQLPRAGSNKQIWLSVLLYSYELDDKGFVHKDEMSKIVSMHLPESATDQQVRHLKRDGWYLISDGKGGHRLNPYEVSPEFLQDQHRLSSILSAKDFEEIKKAFNYTCASCGSREGDSSWRYGNDEVELHKGHKDPEKSMDNKNIIPQCQFCNRAYKDDFTFDDKGRVRSIASINPVVRASDSVKKKVFDYLKNMFE